MSTPTRGSGARRPAHTSKFHVKHRLGEQTPTPSPERTVTPSISSLSDLNRCNSTAEPEGEPGAVTPFRSEPGWLEAPTLCERALSNPSNSMFHVKHRSAGQSVEPQLTTIARLNRRALPRWVHNDVESGHRPSVRRLLSARKGRAVMDNRPDSPTTTSISSPGSGDRAIGRELGRHSNERRRPARAVAGN